MSNPRIIGGTARGVRLAMVPGDVTRPITDRVKEALFNILGPDIIGSNFYDLFGGTGSVGIEALSRGAEFLRISDNNRGAYETIKKNLKTTRFEDKAQVLFGDVFAHLRQPADRAFEYIFIAPPQYKGLWQQTIQSIDTRPDWITEDGWVIVQIDPLEYEKLELKHLSEFDQRRYGSTLLIFYELHTQNEV